MGALAEDEREHLILSLQRSAQTLKGVLDDAGAYLNAPRLTEFTAPCELAKVLGEAHQDIQAQLASRGQTVVIKLPSGLSGLAVDGPALRRSLACLLGSLSRVARHGEALGCTAGQELDQVWIELTGTGRPKDEDYRILLVERITATFLTLKRLDGENLQGWRLTVPVGGLASGRSSGLTSLASGREVLIVEDNALARQALTSMLQRLGMAVRSAGSAEEALSLAGTGSSLVLCDLGLPGDMDGLALAARLRQQAETRDIALIALTGQAAGGVEEAARKAGFLEILEKPLEFQALAELLERLGLKPRERV